MSGVKHTPWEVGQHPAVSNGWIVRPILFGSNVRVLPESEGGHVVIRDEIVARLIAAAPDLLEALMTARETIRALHGPNQWDIYDRCSPEMKAINAAITRATGDRPEKGGAL